MGEFDIKKDWAAIAGIGAFILVLIGGWNNISLLRAVSISVMFMNIIGITIIIRLRK